MEKRYHYITPQDYETAKQNGITAELAEIRAWERGWDIDRAVTTPKRVARCFKGTWGKWKETAARHDVDRILFINRVRSLGWSEEEAATIKKGKSRTPSFWTDEEREIAKRLGIDGNALSIGIELGFDDRGYTPTEGYRDMIRSFGIRKVLMGLISTPIKLVNGLHDERELLSIYTEIIVGVQVLGEMLGFTWDQVEEAYYVKNKINHSRQENNY